jgi:hypothetical protein
MAREFDMRAFLSSVAAAIILAMGAMFVLEKVWQPADKAFSTQGARISHDDSNLVGKDWYSSKRF